MQEPRGTTCAANVKVTERDRAALVSDVRHNAMVANDHLARFNIALA